MVLLSKEDPPQQPLVRLDDEPGPSEALPAPPSFEESAGHVLIDFDQAGALVPTGGELPPPEFTPYDAEYWVSKDKSIISHDPHLNEDGEALYRFLLSQANSPPNFSMHCKGTHTEQRTRLVTKTDQHGQRRTVTEHYTETVTDFDFAVDLTQHVPLYATQWTAGDDEPAYRGLMHREVGAPGDTRKAVKEEVKDFKRWLNEREMRGLPPWISDMYSRREGAGVPMQQRHDVLKSSWTLRQWADDYCASSKVFKEFVYEKVIYGWYIEGLQTAIRSAIFSTHYTGDLAITFESSLAKVIIRPNTRLARMLSNPWLKLLLIVTLVYPFIWLFQNFHSRGGGRWTVAGGAYALKRFEPINVDVYGTMTTGNGQVVLPHHKIVKTSSGPKLLVGMREGEWFKIWEGTIRRMVLARKVDPTPVYMPDDVPNYAAAILDGYD
ncbi:hypothetical protein BV25DRAFT_1818605 [Artomyces pyxidatus]|uniref:Uncharacterized protein n=1 Tax=Artomyces pyxidatus TaxID=48021 RepID=A0ACB8TII0_9AGAM|nr:hypothetical protein BV25DRAFT_1818605 [Artomyces pyxidatus]